MPPIQRGQAYRLGPNRWGLRYYAADGARAQEPVPVQVRRAPVLPRRDRTRAARRDARRSRVDARRARRPVPRAPRRISSRADHLQPARAPLARRYRVRRRAATRPGAHAVGDRRLEGPPARAGGARARGRAQAAARRRCPLGVHRDQPGEGGPQPEAAAARDPRVHERGAGGDRRRAIPPATGRCPPSPRAQGCARRSGSRWSAATSTARSSRSGAPSRAVRSSSSARPPAPAARCP
jgi:hypothetical protein